MAHMVIDILGTSSPSDTARWRSHLEGQTRAAIKRGDWYPERFTPWQVEAVRKLMAGENV